MKVYDLFPFFNELDLLELRLRELDAVVNAFGLVELPRTFTDLPKPLHYRENLLRFNPWNWPSLCHHVPAAYPSGPHPTIDWFQRRALAAHLHDAGPEDVVMLSDVDEIPNRDVVRDVIAGGLECPVTLEMKLYYHRVDLTDPGLAWNGTVICRRKHLGPEPDMQELRSNRHYFPKIADGGWHFSWLGDGAAIAKKLEAVDIPRENEIYGSHGIKEPPNDPKWLQGCYETGKDLFQRGREKVRVPIVPGVNQPHEIVAWLEKYPQYAAMDSVPY